MPKSKLPKLVNILILTLITVIVWVGFDVYRLFNNPPPPIVSKEVSNPLIPNLDQDSINQIESRIYLDDSQIPDNVVEGFTVTSVPEATPIATEQVDASSSGTTAQ